jgi:predicted AAA+ superfamily ATPase
MVFNDYDYITLEDPDEKEFALTDPRGFLKRFAGGVILDEIQRVPSLLSYLQGLVDADPAPGRYILTGSQQLHMMHGVSQTLSGRTAIVILLPFSLNELLGWPPSDPLKIDVLPDKKKSPPFNIEKILHQGLYPRIHDKKLEAHDWLSAYYRTYVERDVRDIANIGNLDTFQRFIRLCAGRTGQLLNQTSLASDCGISHTTARHWISVLQAGFIIHLLPPHHANFSKRVIKSPKLYFLDTGLLCYLLRIREPEEIISHAMRGPVFETFVISELYKAFVHRGDVPPLNFWRDRTGHEVDLVIDTGKNLIPVEIKSGATLTHSMFEGLRYFVALGPPAAPTGVLIHGGESIFRRENFSVKPWYQCV